MAAIIGSLENHIGKFTAPAVFLDSDDMGVHNGMEKFMSLISDEIYCILFIMRASASKQG